jgi:hypothetical protein
MKRLRGRGSFSVILKDFIDFGIKKNKNMRTNKDIRTEYDILTNKLNELQKERGEHIKNDEYIQITEKKTQLLQIEGNYIRKIDNLPQYLDEHPESCQFPAILCYERKIYGAQGPEDSLYKELYNFHALEQKKLTAPTDVSITNAVKKQLHSVIQQHSFFSQEKRYPEKFQLYKLRKAAFIETEKSFLKLSHTDETNSAKNIRKLREVINKGETGTNWIKTFNELRGSDKYKDEKLQNNPFEELVQTILKFAMGLKVADKLEISNISIEDMTIRLK